MAARNMLIPSFTLFCSLRPTMLDMYANLFPTLWCLLGVLAAFKGTTFFEPIYAKSSERVYSNTAPMCCGVCVR